MHITKNPNCRRGYTLATQPNFFTVESDAVRWLAENRLVQRNNTDGTVTLVAIGGPTYRRTEPKPKRPGFARRMALRKAREERA